MKVLLKKFVLFAAVSAFLLFIAAYSLEAANPRITGRVVRVLEDMLFIDAGINKGVQPGDRFEVLKHEPGRAAESIGIIVINQVFEKSALGKPYVLLPGNKVSVNDMIVEYKDVDHMLSYSRTSGYAPIIQDKKVSATNDNLSVYVRVSVLSSEPVLNVYCIYLFEKNKVWQGMALTEEGEAVYSGIIPRSEVTAGRLDYYLVAVDEKDRIGYSGDKGNPHAAVIYLAEPYYSDESETRIFAESKTGMNLSPYYFVPGAAQIKKGRKLKGISLIGLQAAALAAGIASNANQGIYWSLAGLVYFFNIADGVLTK